MEAAAALAAAEGAAGVCQVGVAAAGSNRIGIPMHSDMHSDDAADAQTCTRSLHPRSAFRTQNAEGNVSLERLRQLSGICRGKKEGARGRKINGWPKRMRVVCVQRTLGGTKRGPYKHCSVSWLYQNILLNNGIAFK
jgi:hypothetical protein